MGIKLFESLVRMNRESFRFILENGLKEVCDKNENGEIEFISFEEWIIKRCLNDCESEFEEQTMVENLAEEFQDYLENLKGA